MHTLCLALKEKNTHPASVSCFCYCSSAKLKKCKLNNLEERILTVNVNS